MNGSQHPIQIICHSMNCVEVVKRNLGLVLLEASDLSSEWQIQFGEEIKIEHLLPTKHQVRCLKDFQTQRPFLCGQLDRQTSTEL